MNMDDLKMILLAISTHALCAYIGFIGGNKRKQRDEHINEDLKRQSDADLARQLQATYRNGLRVGRQQMIDEMVHAHLITEDVADALSDGARHE